MRGLSSAVVVLVGVVIAGAAGDRHQQELKEHYDHLAYIAEFNCHRPQPRVISLHELFPEEETLNKAFFPDVTVLHRCDSAVGCCPSNQHCRPKYTQSLHLPFKVTYLEHIGKHKKGSWIIDYHSFENHTECECVDTNVCVPPTVNEETHEESHHTPEHHGESHHEPEHHESSHKPEEHHEESHHEPDHHEESSHKTEEHHEVSHHEESHHEPEHHSESSHKTEEHHEESHHEVSHHSESSNEPDNQYSGDNSSSPAYNSVSSPSLSSEDRPAEVSSSPVFKEQESESSTLPLLVNYVYSSTSSSTTEKAEEKDLSAFFD